MPKVSKVEEKNLAGTHTQAIAMQVKTRAVIDTLSSRLPCTMKVDEIKY